MHLPRAGVALPRAGVAADAPHVDHHAGAPRHGVPADDAVRRRLVEEQRDRRVETQRLHGDAPEEGELLQVALLHAAPEPHHVGELRLQPPEIAGAVQQLRHRPLDRRRHRLRPAEDEVLHLSSPTPSSNATCMPWQWCQNGTYHYDGLDVVARQPERALQLAAAAGLVSSGLVEEREHVVHHVGVLVAGGVADVLVDDPVDDAVEGGARRAEPPVDAVRVEPREPGDEVPDVERAEQLGELLQENLQLAVAAAVARAEGGAKDDVLGEPEDELTEVDGLAGSPGNGADQLGRLVADGAPRLGAPPAEEPQGAELAHLSPEVAVVGEGHVCAAVGEVGDGDARRPVGEVAVLDLEHLARVLRARHHHHVDAAEAEVQQPAVPGRHGRQPAVRQLVHHEHVSDDRQRPRTRRQRRRPTACAPPQVQQCERHGGQDEP